MRIDDKSSALQDTVVGNGRTNERASSSNMSLTFVGLYALRCVAAAAAALRSLLCGGRGRCRHTRWAARPSFVLGRRL